MTGIEIGHGDITVGADLVADGLGLSSVDVQPLMQGGRITCHAERGEGEDADRHRLTFFYGSRRLRLVVDETGGIIWRSVLNYGALPLPAAARKPGGHRPPGWANTPGRTSNG